MEVKGIPFDSPLYQLDEVRGPEYHDYQAVQAMFTIAGDIRPLLPEGLVPAVGQLLAGGFVEFDMKLGAT
jgi:hypothetical protein